MASTRVVRIPSPALRKTWLLADATTVCTRRSRKCFAKHFIRLPIFTLQRRELQPEWPVREIHRWIRIGLKITLEGYLWRSLTAIIRSRGVPSTFVLLNLVAVAKSWKRWTSEVLLFGWGRPIWTFRTHHASESWREVAGKPLYLHCGKQKSATTIRSPR